MDRKELDPNGERGVFPVSKGDIMSIQKIYNVVSVAVIVALMAVVVVINNNHSRVCGYLAALNNDIFEYTTHR